MSHCICITPAGRLIVEDDSDSSLDSKLDVPADVRAEFLTSSAQGLFSLASRRLTDAMPAGVSYWRDFGRQFFHKLCLLGEGAESQWATLPPPDDDVLRDFIEFAPPMHGLEYVSLEVLGRLWGELRELVVKLSRRHAGGAAAWLAEVNPLWHLLGRVTLHLAENKRDPERPFAFLATFTHGLSAGSKLQHLPLAQALKEYAAAKDQTKLVSLLEPVRRASETSELARELLETKSLFQPQAWTVQQAYRFLKDVPQLEAAGLVVRVPNWWHAKRPARPQVHVKVGQKAASALSLDSMLDFRAEITFDGEPLTESERDELLAASDGLALLRGRWVEVNREQLNQALDHWKHLEEQNPDGLSFIEGMRLLAGAQLGEKADDDAETADWSRVTAGDWLRETLQQLRDPQGIGGCEPGQHLQATLRPYQADGVRWLWFMTKLGLGGCLADDMGLGKTIQVIDLLLQFRHEQAASASTVGPTLLVVPASLVGNWKQELAKFAPQLRVFLAHSSECEAAELDRVAKAPEKELRDHDLVVTTYGLARRAEWLSKVSWRLVVLDEAQAIKNSGSAQTKAIKKLPSRGRLVLTGTPVENHLGDLWSLFDFCSPGLLGSASQFKKYVNRLNKREGGADFGGLRQLVRPYILRRMKTDPLIVPDLPDKTELRTDCCLSKKQAVLYEDAVNEFKTKLAETEAIQRRGLVLAALMRFKQLCNHPSQYLHSETFAPEDSGKFAALAELCRTISERQERMLIFTQFQSMTEPLAEYLATLFGRSGLVLHGGTPVKRRQELVKQFQADDGPPFFVISVKAGGAGLNLTAASHVVHFDRWWNPAVENQATDRAFRIGQKKNVLVHKFVCRGTVEERIDQMIRDKQSLSDQVLSEGGEAPLTEMSDKELLDFVAIDLTRALDE